MFHPLGCDLFQSEKKKVPRINHHVMHRWRRNRRRKINAIQRTVIVSGVRDERTHPKRAAP